jgi:hypothetical protein
MHHRVTFRSIGSAIHIARETGCAPERIRVSSYINSNANAVRHALPLRTLRWRPKTTDEMMAHRRAWLMLLFFSITAGVACGSEGHDVGASGSGAHSAAGGGGAGRVSAGVGGAAAAGAGGTTTGGGTGGPLVNPQAVACGSTTCSTNPLLAGFVDACCADPTQGVCGMSSMGAACSAPAVSDPRCPGVDFMGAFMLASCCAVGGQCGIDASMFGMGCIGLADASAMGGGGIGILPAPRACDAADADAGR